MACECCPFAFTDASEEVQNYGCLPTPYDVIQMKRESGHNWACHSCEEDNLHICKGFIEHVKWMNENGSVDKLTDIDTSTGGLISYDVWYREGKEAAVKKANNQ